MSCVTSSNRIHEVYSWDSESLRTSTVSLIRAYLFLPLASRVTGEVKHNLTNTVVCKVQGEWNSVLEFTYSNGETKYVDLTKLAVTKKRVRPLEKQDPFESRYVILGSI